MSRRVRESVEVQAPAADVFGYWSNFENFPLQNFARVVERGELGGPESQSPSR